MIINHIHEITGLRLEVVKSVGGGSIHRATQLKDEASETHYFLKSNASDAAEMFATEARGLSLLRDASSRQDAGLFIPRTIASGKTATEAWLLMEYMSEVRPSPENWFEMGAGLARLHRDDGQLNGQFGLNHDNFIGSLPQHNTTLTGNWSDFFINHRLRPQFRMAANSGRYNAGTAEERLYNWVRDHFPSAPASILHGDLWGGNAMFVKLTDGRIQPALFDPAVYVGHAEADLAFTRLFGGFHQAFYDGYASVSPFDAGLNERRDVLNLYPLLVHVNLFGGGYAAQVDAIVRRFT